jgi:hypothetical protein
LRPSRAISACQFPGFPGTLFPAVFQTKATVADLGLHFRDFHSALHLRVETLFKAIKATPQSTAASLTALRPRLTARSASSTP